MVFPYLSRSPAGCNDTKRLKYVFWMPHCCRNDINNRLVFHRWLKRPATINFFEQVHWRYVYANVRNIDVMHSTKTSWMIILTSYSRLREALKIFFAHRVICRGRWVPSADGIITSVPLLVKLICLLSSLWMHLKQILTNWCNPMLIVCIHILVACQASGSVATFAFCMQLSRCSLQCLYNRQSLTFMKCFHDL